MSPRLTRTAREQSKVPLDGGLPIEVAEPASLSAGMALGTGSALAHRAVDGILGSRNPEPAQAQQAAEQVCTQATQLAAFPVADLQQGAPGALLLPWHHQPEIWWLKFQTFHLPCSRPGIRWFHDASALGTLGPA